MFPPAIRVVDSHTEGEPTRVVIEGWPQPRGATMAERAADMRERADHLRAAVVREPRGHEAVVGALLTPPVEPDSVAGVVFFNNVGYLGMCGHGLIGVVRTLDHLGRLARPAGPAAAPERVGASGLAAPPERVGASGLAAPAGAPAPAAARHRGIRIDTPVGTVAATLEEGGAVHIRNVPAYAHALDARVEVPALGTVVGDVAWGGNWFFIAEASALPRGSAADASRALESGAVDRLAALAADILRALGAAGITGAGGAPIDHVELTGPPARGDADGRNFVLCPGGAYDRSPCGTGTSAKMAALHARGSLRVGEPWRQEGITGGLFTGWLEEEGGALVPHLRGRAFVTAEATLRFDAADPFRGGLPSRGR